MKIKLFWYYIETRWCKLLNILGIKRDSSIIPSGLYCYEYDIERNKKERCSNGSYWIKPCKYYRSDHGGVACTYCGYFGFDPCLYDQCKICGENEDLDKLFDDEQ